MNKDNLTDKQAYIPAKSGVGRFESDFSGVRASGRSPTNCVKGSCKGWSTKGEYYTFNDPTGEIKLDMTVKTQAPKTMEFTINKASFFISNATKD